MSALTGTTVVLSPHPDDAILSLGAAIAHSTQAGNVVRVVTVFGGDESSDAPVGPWHRDSGFRNAGEATRARAAEDDTACRIVGAEALRLPYLDKDFERVLDEDEVLGAVTAAIGACDRLLLPGFPLTNDDHAWLARLCERLDVPASIGYYAEQPYAAWERVPPGEAQLGRRWKTLEASRGAQAAKLRACRAYKSQIPLLGGVRAVLGVLSYEARLGGESVCLP